MELILSDLIMTCIYVFLTAKMTLRVKVRKVLLKMMMKKLLSKRSPPCPVGDDGEDPASDDDAVEEVGGKLAPGKYGENIVT